MNFNAGPGGKYSGGTSSTLAKLRTTETFDTASRASNTVHKQRYSASSKILSVSV